MEVNTQVNPLDVLKTKVGSTFLKKRHGVVTAVELVQVKPRKVVLRYPNRVDTFTIPIEEFLRFYHAS